MVIFHSYVSLPEGNTFHFPPNESPVFSALGYRGICAGHFRGDQPQRRAESTETVRRLLIALAAEWILGGFPLGIS